MRRQQKSSDSNQYDALAIGSGIGGLTVAALLAKFNQKRVLMLEQHLMIGGLTQEVKRQGFRWDIGVQAVGDLGEGEAGRAVFDYITDGQLQWQPMPTLAEKIIYPDLSWEIQNNSQQYRADLSRLFPEEKVNLQRYFQELGQVANWCSIHQLEVNSPLWFRQVFKPLWGQVSQLAHLTVKEYLDRNFHNPRLKALLTSQWYTYGLPPAQSAFGVHALVMNGYGKGSWYPRGGAQAIAKSILPTLERAGGKAIAQCLVTEILIEDGRAIGVKARKTHEPDAESQEYYAPIIISDAGAYNTYTKLIPKKYATAYREQIEAFPKGYSTLILFVGLKESPERLGIDTPNYWIHTSYDHDEAWAKQLESPEKLPTSCYLSFPSLKEPTVTHHTAKIMVLANYDWFTKWQGQSWQERAPDYYELKEKIAQNLIKFVESYYPGFSDAIAYYELATPLTVEYFDQSDRGAIYGIPSIPARLEQPWIGSKTPIENLYLTGTDALGHGIIGAMMGGVQTAGILNGPLGFLKIMSALTKKSESLQLN